MGTPLKSSYRANDQHVGQINWPNPVVDEGKNIKMRFVLSWRTIGNGTEDFVETFETTNKSFYW